jgi:hypothetical protein
VSIFLRKSLPCRTNFGDAADVIKEEEEGESTDKGTPQYNGVNLQRNIEAGGRTRKDKKIKEV